MRPLLETKSLIYQSKVKVDIKIVFINALHFLDSEIRKMLVRGLFFWDQFVCVGTSGLVLEREFI